MTPEGLEFVAAWEGLRTRVYRDIAGYRTIGVGHLIVDGEDYVEGVEYDHDDLMALFAEDVQIYEAAVERHVSVPLAPHQFDALVSFVFNVGEHAFSESTLLARVNVEAFDEVPPQLLRWVHAGGREVPGLVRRREAEGAVWTYAQYPRP